ncbi:MAG TPA: hypothetical protein VKZ60_11085 [Chloroflexota bacterium]|jgi:hypothetical protein|nr:hypothetical protein [Chloroflexota bacterium]
MARALLLQVPLVDERTAYLRLYDTALELERPAAAPRPEQETTRLDYREIARARLRAGPHLAALAIEDANGRVIHTVLGAADARRVVAILRAHLPALVATGLPRREA